MNRDPYDILGVSRNASEDEVEEAYRRKAKEYHPDVCERDDAAELFKRVKQAYEAALADKERGKSRGERNGQKEATRKTGEGGGNEKGGAEGFEVFESHDGWHLGRRGDGWYVFTETETAPHVEETVLMYLGADGTVSSEPVRYDAKEDARRAYMEAYGKAWASEETGSKTGGRNRRGEDGARDRGNAGSRKRTDTRSEERTDTEASFDDGGVIWGETRPSSHLDSLWRLCYQEGRTRESGETVRRWGVTTDVTGDERYINKDGEYQGGEFWFPTEDDARKGYERYIRGMRRARGQEDGVGKGRGGERGASASRHARRHPVVQAVIEEAAGVFGGVSPLSYLSSAADELNARARNPVISFLHYVTFPRIAAFTEASLKALVIGYAAFVVDTVWGPGVVAGVFGEGVVIALTGGLFPLVVYFAVVVLLFASLLED